MLTTARLSSKNNEAVRMETWYIQSFTQVEHPLIYSGDKQYPKYCRNRLLTKELISLQFRLME